MLSNICYKIKISLLSSSLVSVHQISNLEDKPCWNAIWSTFLKDLSAWRWYKTFFPSKVIKKRWDSFLSDSIPSLVDASSQPSKSISGVGCFHQLFPPLTRYHIPETFVTTFRNQLSVLRNKILKLQWWGHFGRIPSYRTTELLCFVRDTKSLNHQNRARQKINHECPKPSEDPKFQKSIDQKKPRINSGSKKTGLLCDDPI